jgi:hypothetical protein
MRISARAENGDGVRRNLEETAMINAAQRRGILGASLVIAAMVLYPPWQVRVVRSTWAAYEYSWIFSPPSADNSDEAVGDRIKERYRGKYEDRSSKEIGRLIRVAGYPQGIGLESSPDVRIDAVRLVFQCAAVVMVTGALVVVMRRETL